MANFLTVNGLVVPVALNSFEEGEPEVIGASERAASGGLVESLVATKRAAAFKTTPQLASVAEAWNQLLRGEGERWSFDADLYGSKGSTTTTTTGIARSTVYKKHGAASLDVSFSNTFTLPGSYSSHYSVLVWKYDAGAWNHYAISYNGAQTVYRNGANYGSSIASWFSASGGTITITGPDYFDDLVVMPFALPASWLAAIYSWHNANPWSALPTLRVAGDAIPDPAGYRLCKGVVKGANLMRGALGGTKYSNLTQLSVGLLEV